MRYINSRLTYLLFATLYSFPAGRYTFLMWYVDKCNRVLIMDYIKQRRCS